MTIEIKSAILGVALAAGLGLNGVVLAQTTPETTTEPATTETPPALPPALPATPEPATPPPLPPQPDFYIDENGTPGGPYKMAQLQALVAAGTLTATTLAWTDGMAEWAAANTVAGLEPLFVAAVAPTPTPAPAPAPAPGIPAADLTTYVVGNWLQTGDVDIPGVGLGSANLAAVFAADGSFTLGGSIDATNAETGTMTIQINAGGTYVVQSLGPDTFSVTQTGSATMTIPGFAPVLQPLAETTTFKVIDANTIEDTITGDRLLRQP